MNVTRCEFREQVKDTWRIAFYVAMIVVAAVFAKLSSVTHDVGLGIACGAAGGCIGHWRATGPASMNLAKGFARHAKIWFETKGYVRGESDERLVPNLPRALRFNSQDIKFSEGDERTIVITGPYYMLKRFENSHGR